MYEREKTLEQESAQFFSGTCYGDYTAWGVECRKESVQAADTVIYQENFSESTDGWTPEWSVGSDLTTFAVGKIMQKIMIQALIYGVRKHRYSRLHMRCQP